MRLFCHWWQESDESMISAMTIALVLLFLITTIAALAAWSRHDGLSSRPRTAWFD